MPPPKPDAQPSPSAPPLLGDDSLPPPLQLARGSPAGTPSSLPQPKFVSAWLDNGAGALATEELAKSEKGLLQTQLQDLDSWCNEQRSRVGRSLFSPRSDVSYPDEVDEGEESRRLHLLEAQAREVRYAADNRHRSMLAEKAAMEQHTKRMGEQLGAPVLLVELGQARRKAATLLGGHLAANPPALVPIGPRRGAHMEMARHCAASAWKVLRKLLTLGTSRQLAIERVRSARLQTAKDFSFFTARLKAASSTGPTSNLSQYTTTDVALAFAGALSQRFELMKFLSQLLSERRLVQQAVVVHEQRVACSVLEAVGLGPEAVGRRALVAPAAWLALEAEAAGLPAQKLMDLSAINLRLWSEFAAATASARQGSNAIDSMGDSGDTVARRLRAELQNLKTSESRLDALLVFETIAPDGAPLSEGSEVDRLWASTGLALEAAGDRLETDADVLTNLLKAKGRRMVTAGMEPVVGSRAQLDERMFHIIGDTYLKAWRSQVSKVSQWRREARLKNRRRYLGAPGPKAWFLWFLVCSLKVPVLRNVPKIQKRLVNKKVRDNYGFEGVVMALDDDGYCNVLYEESFGGGKNHELSVPISSLMWLIDVPHPAMSYVAFAAWSLTTKRLLNADVVSSTMYVKINRKKILMIRYMFWFFTFDNLTLMRFVFTHLRHCVVLGRDDSLTLTGEIFVLWCEAVQRWRSDEVMVALSSAQADLYATLSKRDSLERGLVHLEAAIEKFMHRYWKQFARVCIGGWKKAIEVSQVQNMRDKLARTEGLKAYWNLLLRVGKLITYMYIMSMLKRSFEGWMGRIQRTRSFEKNSNFFDRRLIDVVIPCWKSWVMAARKEDRTWPVQKYSQLLSCEADLAYRRAVATHLAGLAMNANRTVIQLQAAVDKAAEAIEAGTRVNYVLEARIREMQADIRAEEETLLVVSKLEPKFLDLIRKDARNDYVLEMDELMAEQLRMADRILDLRSKLAQRKALNRSLLAERELLGAGGVQADREVAAAVRRLRPGHTEAPSSTRRRLSAVDWAEDQDQARRPATRGSNVLQLPEEY